MGDRLAHRHTLSWHREPHNACFDQREPLMLSVAARNLHFSTCGCPCRDDLPDYWACGSRLEYKSYEVEYLNLHINIQKLRQGKPHEATSHLSQDYSSFYCPHYHIALLSMLKRKWVKRFPFISAFIHQCKNKTLSTSLLLSSVKDAQRSQLSVSSVNGCRKLSIMIFIYNIKFF